MRKIYSLLLAFLLAGGILKSQVNVTGGTSASYTSLGDAFTAINAGTHTGAITIDVSASTTETASAVLNSSGSGSANYTSVLIYPSVDNVTISCVTLGGRGVIELNGADNVTIDGDNPNTSGTNRNLTVMNTAANTLTYSSVVRIATAAGTGFTDASNITIKNLKLIGNASGQNVSGTIGSGTSANTTFGIVAGVNGGSVIGNLSSVTIGITTGNTVDNLVVNNNEIGQCARAVAFIGNTSSSSSSGVNITNNTIGANTATSGSYPYTFTTTAVYTKGIILQGVNSATITGNTFKNIFSYVGTTISGVELTAFVGTGGVAINSNTFTTICQNGNGASSASRAINLLAMTSGSTYTISNNTINNIQSSASTQPMGIAVGGSATSGLIEKNTITTVYNRYASTYGVLGMYLNGGNNITVRNNFISDINRDMTGGAGFSSGLAAFGILVNSGTGHKIYHNSVNLFGTYFGTANSSLLSAAFGIASTSYTGIDVRNNIFSNTLSGGSTSIAHVAIYLPSGATSAMNLLINNNAYYTGTSTTTQGLAQVGSSAGTGFYLASNFNAASTGPANNLRAYTSTLGNVNSDNASFATTAAAPFMSNTDLHINNSLINPLESGGATIGVATDIDLDVRPGPVGSVNGGGTAPDIGADEFDGLVPAGCSGTPSSNTVIASSTAVCSGASSSLSLSVTYTATGITYQWGVATTSVGPYSSITSGTLATLTASNLVSSSWYQCVITCTNSSASTTATPLMITVNSIPTASINSNAPFCSGQALNLAGGTDIGTTFMWNGPSGFSSVLQNPSISNVQANASGIYTLTAAASGCTSTPVTASVTVNATPSAITVSASSSTICSGNSSTLTATGGLVPNTFNFGTQTTQNSSTTYPAPYSAYYGGQRMQMLVLASELTAAGFSSGSTFNSIQFAVVSKGSNWGTSITSNQNFQVKIGATSLTSLTAFQSGVTSVYGPANYTPSVGFGNTHTFSTPFVWNGTSNIILETTFSNNFTGGSSDAVIQYTSSTSFQSCIVYRADVVTASTAENATTVSTGPFSGRPDFKLNGTAFGAYNWNPSSSLSSATGATVNATPLSNTTYSVSVINSGCTTSDQITINVNPTPTVVPTTSSFTICSGSSATLTATGATTYSWSSGATGSVTVESPMTSITYSVTGDNGSCTGLGVVTVSVIATPTVTTSASTPSICSGNSATLTASGATSYSWSSGAMTAATVESPSSTTTYTVTGDDNGCTGMDMITISVTTTPTLTTSASPAFMCSGFSSTLTANGASTYSWSSGAMTAVTVESPSSTTTYTVTGDNGGCTGMDVITLTVNPTPTVTASASSGTICSGLSTTLTASGAATYSWSSGAMTASTVESPTSNTTYTVTGDNGGCTSTDVVSIAVNASPTVSAVTSTSLICSGSSATLTASGALTYTWSSGTMAASTVESPTISTTYTVTGTDVNGCEDMDTLIQMVSPCLGIDVKLQNAEVLVYPNPNSGLLNISVPDVNGNVSFELYDAIGRLVMTMKLTENLSQLNTNELPGGVYTYRIKSEGNTFQQGKLVRE